MATGATNFFRELKKIKPRLEQIQSARVIERRFDMDLLAFIGKNGFPDDECLAIFLSLVSLHDLPKSKILLEHVSVRQDRPVIFKLFITALVKNAFFDAVVNLLEHRSDRDKDLQSYLAIALCEVGNVNEGLRLFDDIEATDGGRPVNLNYILEINVAMKRKLPPSILAYLARSTIAELQTKTLTLLMLRSWLNGNQDEFDQFYLELHQRYSADRYPSSKTERKFCVAYFIFMQHLIRARPFPRTQLALPIFGVVGESHCLTWHGLEIALLGKKGTAMSNWIPGVKAFHVKSTKETRMKTLLGHHVSQLKAKCGQDLLGVIFTIGEIDCRIDEGIMNAIAKQPVDQDTQDDLIRKTVFDYVQVIHDLGRQHEIGTIYVCGVPAPNKDHLQKKSSEESILKDLCSVIAKFNNYLRTDTLKYGLYFIDLHTLTLGEEGYAKAGSHLDGVHLNPLMFSDSTNLEKHIHCPLQMSNPYTHK